MRMLGFLRAETWFVVGQLADIDRLLSARSLRIARNIQRLLDLVLAGFLVVDQRHPAMFEVL